MLQNDEVFVKTKRQSIHLALSAQKILILVENCNILT